MLLVVRVCAPSNLWCIGWSLRSDSWTHPFSSFYTFQGNGSTMSESKYCPQYLYNIGIVFINRMASDRRRPNSVELPRFSWCFIRIRILWKLGLHGGYDLTMPAKHVQDSPYHCIDKIHIGRIITILRGVGILVYGKLKYLRVWFIGLWDHISE